MSEEAAPRSGRFGAIVVGIAVGVSFVGVMGWYLLTNRGGPDLDTSGFDMASAPETARPAVAPAAPEAAPASGLGMLQADPGLTVAAPGSSSPSSAKPGDQSPAGDSGAKSSPSASFKEASIKHTRAVYEYGRKMEAKYPSLTQYAKDWNSYPDLKALKDQYWKDRDPVKFLYGVSKSDNFGKLVGKYSKDPGVRAFVMNGVKEVPGDLMGAASQLFQSDGLVKNLVGTVAKGLGMPPSMMSMLGGGDAAKPPSQQEIMSGIMGNPELQKAMKNQNSPVSLQGQGLDQKALQNFNQQR
jgi:hypothetical protein